MALKRPRTLSAFSSEEREIAHSLLATRVAYMMGRKLEEGDWAEVYCRAKNIPLQGWSNLHIDVMHNLLGVEHKMYRVRSDQDISTYCGQHLMHPSELAQFGCLPPKPAPTMRWQ